MAFRRMLHFIFALHKSSIEEVWQCIKLFLKFSFRTFFVSYKSVYALNKVLYIEVNVNLASDTVLHNVYVLEFKKQRRVCYIQNTFVMVLIRFD